MEDDDKFFKTFKIHKNKNIVKNKKETKIDGVGRIIAIKQQKIIDGDNNLMLLEKNNKK